ncbi:LLM class flavin-dependent oxidoreductase [Immundisolibacter sp.]|uniref:LLM class flavin-dependent oxidoreductase n=1 Tax=Immundisolibacter sp. TaxID=1934948 RepID=UPI003569E39F
MKFILFYLPSVGTIAQTRKGMAGINSQNYQNMLWQVSEQIKFADRAGFWGAAFTEHHFHIEGIEQSNNPILLDLYFGMQTTRIRLGQMANVLPFHNPLRLAEDLAMLDQMLQGRTFIGFARGYQKRWADVLGQTYGVGGTMSDKSEVDKKNRNLFMEHYEIIKKAWTTDVFNHRSEHWTIPPDNLKFGHKVVDQFGKGQNADGIITEIGIAPKTFQKPHPPIFQPFSFSEDTFRFCAREAIAPFALSTCDETLHDLFTIYREEAAKAGHNFAHGQNIGIFRDALVLDDAAEAHRYAATANGFVWPEWFAPIGFNEAFRKKGQTGKIGPECDYNYLNENGFEFVGNPDQVNRQIENMVKLHNPEYFLMWQYPGPIPHHIQMRNLELWATEILPNWQD